MYPIYYSPLHFLAEEGVSIWVAPSVSGSNSPTLPLPRSYSRYSNGKPALVFCGSKKDTETLAGSLAQSTDYARRTGSQARDNLLVIFSCKHISYHPPNIGMPEGRVELGIRGGGTSTYPSAFLSSTLVFGKQKMSVVSALTGLCPRIVFEDTRLSTIWTGLRGVARRSFLCFRAAQQIMRFLGSPHTRNRGHLLTPHISQPPPTAVLLGEILVRFAPLTTKRTGLFPLHCRVTLRSTDRPLRALSTDPPATPNKYE